MNDHAIQKDGWPEGGELRFLTGLLKKVGSNKRVFWIALILGLAVTVAVVVFVPRGFIASTSLLVPGSQNASASAAMAQFGGAAAALGSVGASKGLDDLYVSLLGSRRISDSIVRRCDLQSHYDLQSLEETVKKLKKKTAVSLDKKSGLILVEVTDYSSEYAVKIANSYAEELQLLVSNLAVTDAKRKRIFLESQILEARARLDSSETSFKTEQEKSGWIVPQAMAEFNTKTAAALKSQIIETEMQLTSLSKFLTPSNSEYIKAASKLDSLRQQLSIIEGGTKTDGKEPAVGGGAVKAYRQLRLDEVTLEGLMKQYETVKIEEAREGVLIQRIDMAIATERPVVPDRKIVALVGVLASFFAALIAACLVKRDAAAH
jgi:tyrosine-protein kinase Etk/Wzc